MALRNTQIQRVEAKGHEGVMGVTLEEIKEAIENRPIPNWLIAEKMLLVQLGEFTVADFAQEIGVSNVTARVRLARCIKEGRLTRTQRKQSDGRRVWAYREVKGVSPFNPRKEG